MVDKEFFDTFKVEYLTLPRMGYYGISRTHGGSVVPKDFTLISPEP